MKRDESGFAHARVALPVLLALFTVTVPAYGQVRRLSLEDALRRAEEGSERVAVARAGVMRAEGQRRQARSEFFPQIFGSLGYTRTLASEFEALRGDGGEGEPAPGPEPPAEDCGEFMPSPSLPLEQRVDSLEAFVRCTSTADPFSAFRDLPFGRENQWTVGLTASQTLFAGGRVLAQNRAASASVRAAEIALSSARASVVLEVAQAYYDAALADRLLEIAEATLAQAETTLEQVRVGLEVGEQPEFELLRAQVTRDTQQPVVIQRRSQREIARMRLAQLLDQPLDQPIELTSALEAVEDDLALRVATELLDVLPDTAVDARAPVRQAIQTVEAQEAQIGIARSQRWPALSLSTSWSRVNYPEGAFPQSWDRFRTNWTVSASVSVPIFTGGRISGEVMAAEASAEEARALLAETREATALDTRSALEQLEASQATWLASAGTIEQAERAFEIAQIRFQEGLSTQLELSDSRILLQQAQANRAQAARDLLVSRLRVALLPLLPIDQGGTFDPTQGGGFQPVQPVPLQPQQTAPGIRAQQASQAAGGAAAATRTGGR